MSYKYIFAATYHHNTHESTEEYTFTMDADHEYVWDVALKKALRNEWNSACVLADLKMIYCEKMEG